VLRDILDTYFYPPPPAPWHGRRPHTHRFQSLLVKAQACCTAVNLVLHLHLALYPAFQTLGAITARTVTFASFGVNSSGKDIAMNWQVVQYDRPTILKRRIHPQLIVAMGCRNITHTDVIIDWGLVSLH